MLVKLRYYLVSYFVCKLCGFISTCYSVQDIPDVTHSGNIYFSSAAVLPQSTVEVLQDNTMYSEVPIVHITTWAWWNKTQPLDAHKQLPFHLRKRGLGLHILAKVQ